MPSAIADISEVLLQLGLADSCSETERALVQEALRFSTGCVLRFLRYDPTYAERTEYLPQNDFRRAGRQSIWEVTDTQAYERYLSEFVSNELQVSNLPIRSITSLHVDYDGRAGTRPGSFGVETLKVLGTDYWPNFDGVDSSGNKVCRDGIIRSQGTWPDLAGSVKVVYFSGYTDAELHGQDSVIDASPILEATIDETVRRFLKIYSRKKNRLAGFVGPLSSESLGDYSYSSNSAVFGAMVGGNGDLMPESQAKLVDFCRMDLGVL